MKLRAARRMRSAGWMPARCARIAVLVMLASIAGNAHARPAQRIVSLAPHLTELAFSAGAADRLVATVEFSDQPVAARSIPRIGDAFRVDYERLLALRPDAVLVWESGTPVQVIERIRSLGLRVIAIRTQRVEHVAAALRQIGKLAGTEAVADSAAATFESEIETLRSHYRRRAPVRVFLQVNDRPLYTVNGRQIMSEILEICGGRNVFADLAEIAPAVSIEAVIASDPQAIISTDHTVPDAVAFWGKWRHITAVRTGNVYTLRSDDIARATMRLAVGAREVCRTLDTARNRLQSGANR